MTFLATPPRLTERQFMRRIVGDRRLLGLAPLLGWGCYHTLRSDVTPANADLVARLEPLGRAGDGGLRLRAPPGQQLGRFARLVAVALTGAGDAAGNHAAIVETG